MANAQKELSLPVNQMLALFNRSMRKLSEHYRELQETGVEQSLAPMRQVEMEPSAVSLEDDMAEAGREANAELKRKHEELITALDLEQYAVTGNEDAWREALDGTRKTGAVSSISVVSSAKSTPHTKAKHSSKQSSKKQKTRR